MNSVGWTRAQCWQLWDNRSRADESASLRRPDRFAVYFELYTSRAPAEEARSRYHQPRGLRVFAIALPSWPIRPAWDCAPSNRRLPSVLERETNALM